MSNCTPSTIYLRSRKVEHGRATLIYKDGETAAVLVHFDAVVNADLHYRDIQLDLSIL